MLKHVALMGQKRDVGLSDDGEFQSVPSVHTASAKASLPFGSKGRATKVTFSSRCRGTQPATVTGKQSRIVLMCSCFLNISSNFKKEEY